MTETTNDNSTPPEADSPQFELTADHLAVLAHMHSLEAWRFCRRRRRHVVTPDFGTFMAAVCRMGFAAYCDLESAAPRPAADIDEWMLRRRLRPS